MDTALQVAGTVIVALIAAAVTWITTKVQHRGKPENALIDQLQENIKEMKADIAVLKTEQTNSKRRERIMADYVNSLRQHIESGSPPPPPPWPSALFE